MIANINNGESGSSIRAKLNQVIGEVNNGVKSATFSQSIPFDHPHTVMYKPVVAAITFSPNTTGAVIGNGTEVVLIADGVHVPDFSAFSQMSGSSGYSNISGRENLVIFYKNAGGHYVYTISCGAVYDLVPPTIVSISTTAVDKIALLFSKNVFLTQTGFSFKKKFSKSSNIISYWFRNFLDIYSLEFIYTF